MLMIWFPTNPTTQPLQRIRQFLDIGTGLPTVDNTHEVAPTPYDLRGPERIASFFDGLELVEPGVVSCPRWRPDPLTVGEPFDMDEYCAIGRK